MKPSRAILLILGFFAVMGAVDAAFIMLATSSYPGTVTSNSYQKGMSYNKVLQQAKQQSELGWLIKSKVLRKGKNKILYEMILEDKDGFIDNATISVLVVRPLADKLDFTVKMMYMENGIYQALISLPQMGQWELRSSILKGSNDLYYRERIILD